MGSLTGLLPSASIRQVSFFHAGAVLGLSESFLRSSCLVATRCLPSGDHTGRPLLSEILPGLLLPAVSQFQMPSLEKKKGRESFPISHGAKDSCPFFSPFFLG